VALARGFAHKLIALRNRLAPHVTLAWHLSTWGTDEDPTYSKPSLAHMRALGRKSAAFYESLHAHFNLVFNDVTDRDAGFYQFVEHNPKTWWGPADFRRHDAYLSAFTQRTHTPVVLWQLPVGNTTLDNTSGHYQDNRLQWWLDDPSGAHLRATRNAGVVGLLFGGGADGTTTPQTDGGFFYRLARGYASHPLTLSGSPSRPSGLGSCSCGGSTTRSSLQRRRAWTGWRSTRGRCASTARGSSWRRGCSHCRGSGALTATRCGTSSCCAPRRSPPTRTSSATSSATSGRCSTTPLRMPLSYLRLGYAHNPYEEEARRAAGAIPR